MTMCEQCRERDVEYAKLKEQSLERMMILVSCIKRVDDMEQKLDVARKALEEILGMANIYTRKETAIAEAAIAALETVRGGE